MKEFVVKRSIKVKIISVVLFCVFLITATLGYLSFEFSKRRLVSMLGDSIKGLATSIASFILPEDLSLILANSEKLKAPGPYAASNTIQFAQLVPRSLDGEKAEAPKPPPDHAKVLYARYTKLLEDIKMVNNIDSPINVYVSAGSRLLSVLTSESSFLIGIPFVMRPEAKDALGSGRARSTDIYRDKDGTWISAYAPGGYLDAENGQIVVEINYRIDSYVRKLRKELAVIIAICIVGFLGVAFISYYLVTTLVSSIKRLDEAVEDLERERYDKPIDVVSDDEIGHLATTFELLRKSIRKKIEELKLALSREKKAHLESVIALTNAIEMRDPYTKEHVSRVQEYALLIAKGMRLSRDEMIKLKYSCFLHDIGKVYIEESLLKKGTLTEEDFEEIKKHAERGAKIIEGVHFLSDVKDAVLFHQERYDGSGYPKGLKGEEIPLLARIVSVADAFDAMTTDRPYRQKISFKEAMDEIEKYSGTQFDPDVCAAFLKYRDTIEQMAKKHFENNGG